MTYHYQPRQRPSSAKSAACSPFLAPKNHPPCPRFTELEFSDPGEGDSGSVMSFVGTQQKCKACEKTVYAVEQISADGVCYHRSCFKCSHCKGTLKLSNFSSLEGVLYCKPHFEQLLKETGNFSKSFQSPAKPDDKSTPELAESPRTVENTVENTVEKSIPELTESPSLAEKSTPELVNTVSQTGSPNTAEKVIPELKRSPSKFQRSTPELTRSPSKAAGMFSGTQEKCVTCGKTAYPLEKVTVEGESYHKSCFKCSHGGCSISPSNYAALEGILYCKPHFSQLFKEKGSYNHLIKCASIKRTAASVPDM